MNEFKDKQYVFVISAGRTGTRFFGTQMGDMIAQAHSVHEPDVLSFKKGYDFLSKLRMLGFYHLVLGKLLGTTGIRNLSQNILSNRITQEQLHNAIVKHRQGYYETIKHPLVIESYSGWYGCIPAIREMYKDVKIVIVSRDPRSWVTSTMNWGTVYGARDWASKLGVGRLSPGLINDQEYLVKWKSMDAFERVCWTYKAQYEIMLDAIEDEPNAILVKFEDMFYSSKRYETLNSLMDFVTTFSSASFEYTIPDNVLDNQVHKNTNHEFPEYENWTTAQKQSMHDICQPVMKRLNYEQLI